MFFLGIMKEKSYLYVLLTVYHHYFKYLSAYYYQNEKFIFLATNPAAPVRGNRFHAFVFALCISGTGRQKA